MRNLMPALVAVFALSNTGCIKKVLLDGQIESTRTASPVLDTIADFELARGAASASLVTLEGFHRLGPTNENALYMLIKGWTGYAFAFAEDEMEIAQDADNDDLAEYHKRRARMAYDRAVFYGNEYMAHYDKGFDENKKNADMLKKWLTAHF